MPLCIPTALLFIIQPFALFIETKQLRVDGLFESTISG